MRYYRRDCTASRWFKKCRQRRAQRLPGAEQDVVHVLAGATRRTSSKYSANASK